MKKFIVGFLLLVNSFLLLSACGSESSSSVEDEQEFSEEAVPVENIDDIYSYEVKLKDGRTVQCVVSYWGSAPSMQCDFDNAEDLE